MIHDTIKQRLRAALLTTGPGKTYLDTAARLASEMTDEGTWTEFTGEAAATDGGIRHLERTLLLAKARHLSPGELDGPVHRALDWWLARDPQTGDWHRDQVEAPRLVGETALLCGEDLSLGAWGKIVEVLARSRWARWEAPDGWCDWTGAALAGVAYNVILRGCLEKVPALCETAFRRAFLHTRWKQPGEADQANGSSAGETFPWVDNLRLAQDHARLLTLAHGTPWQAPAESVRSFVGYLLDFLQWTMRQSVAHLDPSGGAATLENSNLAGLAAAIVHLSQLGNPPRREELLAFAERLQGHGKPLTGHRAFWRSRVTFHQRPAFYSSLRLKTSPSSRQDFAPAAAPPVASTLYFLRDGQEYAGMQEHWNLRQLPGLTAIQRDAPFFTGDQADLPRMLGCIGEGEFGVAALGHQQEGLQARKAWFFLDESVVCLDAGVRGPVGNHPVYTTVNQCRFQGTATADLPGRERLPLVPGHTYDLTAVRRVEHGGFLYHFPTPLHVVARVSQPPSNGHAPAHGNGAVFSLCIDHGLQPAGAAAAYAVLPLGADPSALAHREHEIAQLDLLANTAAVQAVGHRGARLLAVVFWEAGVVALPGGGRIAANRSCLLLCRTHPEGGTTLTVSNLLNQPATVHVEYAGQCVSFDLPGGVESGRSLSRQL